MGYLNSTLVHYREDGNDQCQTLVKTNDHDQYDGLIDGVLLAPGPNDGDPMVTDGASRIAVPHDTIVPIPGTMGSGAELNDNTWHSIGECPGQFSSALGLADQ